MTSTITVTTNTATNMVATGTKSDDQTSTAKSSFGYGAVPHEACAEAAAYPSQNPKVDYSPPGLLTLPVGLTTTHYRFDTVVDTRRHLKLHHAAALRWLGANGYNNEGAGGHMTVRDPELLDHFWINPHARSLSHMLPEDLCLVNEDDVVVEGGNMHAVNPAEYVIHSAVHKARPDVWAVVHCHSIPSKAFAAFGKELDMISQDCCRDSAAPRSRRRKARTSPKPLGPTNKAVILQNHGILAVSKTPDGAAFNFGALDRCIEAQLLADAAGKTRGREPIVIGHEEAEYTRRLYNDELEYITFQPAFEDTVHKSNGMLTMTSGGEKYPAWNEQEMFPLLAESEPKELFVRASAFLSFGPLL